MRGGRPRAVLITQSPPFHNAVPRVSGTRRKQLGFRHCAPRSGFAPTTCFACCISSAATLIGGLLSLCLAALSSVSWRFLFRLKSRR